MGDTHETGQWFCGVNEWTLGYNPPLFQFSFSAVHARRLPCSSTGCLPDPCVNYHLTKAAEDKPIKNWKAAFQAG